MYVAHELFIEVSLFQEICSAPNNPWLSACNFHLKFIPNFILISGFLRIYPVTVN